MPMVEVFRTVVSVAVLLLHPRSRGPGWVAPQFAACATGASQDSRPRMATVIIAIRKILVLRAMTALPSLGGPGGPHPNHAGQLTTLILIRSAGGNTNACLRRHEKLGVGQTIPGPGTAKSLRRNNTGVTTPVELMGFRLVARSSSLR